MRPCFPFLKISNSNVSAPAVFTEAGLPVSPGVVYNPQQKLPNANASSSCSAELLNGPMEAERMSSGRTNSSSHTQREGGSPSAKMVNGETREARLARIRREIEAGTYETPEKLDYAISRMMGVLID